MAKRGRKKKVDVGEQLQLIEVAPENMEKISKHLKTYKKAQAERLRALKIESDEKQKILALVHKENLSRLPDGMIRFTCDGLLVEITPTDEVIKIKSGPKKDGDKSMEKTVEETE